MADVFDDVLRFAPPAVLDALDDRPSSYDVDGIWQPSYRGLPTTPTPGAFGADELVGALRAIAYLGAMLPVGAQRRSALPALFRKVGERCANPELLLFGGWFDDPAQRARIEERARGSHALIVESNYLFFRPKWLVDEADIAMCESLDVLAYPNSVWPWSSTIRAWQAFHSPGVVAMVARVEDTPVPAGRWEIDPRVSAPALVSDVQKAHGLGEDAATLFLQLLTLADCGDAFLLDVNGWKASQHKKAAAELVAKGLLLDTKQPRANRKYALPGIWETLRPPNPAIERWKLRLYDAEMRGHDLAVPLGRILPLRPVHELFAKSFELHVADAHRGRTVKAPARDWMRELTAAPDDDQLRLVYADWLIEQGDPRGELIVIQLAPDREKLAAAEAALLTRHAEAWTEAIHPFVKSVRFDRGFIAGVTAHAPTFVKHAAKIFAAAPFLTDLTLDAGPVGPIPTAHWRQLGACERFARITHLDTTADHYVACREDLAVLLGGAHFPRLRSLKLGFHRSNQGLGLAGVEMLAACERLGSLRHLELAGQNAGIKSMLALLESPRLANVATLRLPLNGISDVHARRILERLEAGLAPALRVLDLSNTVATDFVTAVVAMNRNTVEPATMTAIAAVLGSR